MMAIQEICDRMALATGKTLGELARTHFGRWARACIGALIIALVVANALNIAADLVAIGSGMQLLHAGPSWIWALAAGAAITALILLGGFAKIQQVFKLLCLSLLTYIVVLFAAHVPWAAVGRNTVIPHVSWSKSYLQLLVAVLGTTISPYLFFWQTADRVEEMRAEDAGGEEPLPLDRRTTLGAKRQTTHQPLRRVHRNGPIQPGHVRHHHRHHIHPRPPRRHHHQQRRSSRRRAQTGRREPRVHPVRVGIHRLGNARSPRPGRRRIDRPSRTPG
jgi:Mn2+/Fe2+ NRAMP family transporter